MVTNIFKKQLVVDYELSFTNKKRTSFYSKIALEMQISRLGVSGEVGSGKSCFLKAIAGVLGLKNCRVIFDGLLLRNIPLYQRKVVYLWQESSLFPHLNVLQNLYFSPFAKDFPEKNYFLDIFKVHQLLDKNSLELSGGEKQKVCLLQALFSHPRLLLLDEPFSCLDLATKTNLMSAMVDYQKKYKTIIIFASHSTEELIKFSSQRVLLNNGAMKVIQK